MGPINGVGTSYTPGTTPGAANEPIDAKATGPTGFDVLAFVDASESAAPDASSKRLLTLGMTPPKAPAASATHGSGDSGSIAQQADKPFDMSEVSATFLEFMLAYRKAARLDRQSSLEGQVKELLGAADKMRDAAESNFNAALAQGIASIVGGAIQGVVGAVQLKTLSGMKQNIAERGSALEPETPTAKRSSQSITTEIEPNSGSSRNSQRASAKSEVEFEMIIEEFDPRQGNRSSAKAPKAESNLVDQVLDSERSGAAGSKPEGRRAAAEMSAENAAELEKTLLKDDRQKVLESKFQFLTTKSQLANAMGQSASGLLVEGPAKIAAAIETKNASINQAESQEMDARAKKAEAAYSAASEEAQTTREAFNKVLDMIAEIDRSRSETSKSIARI